MDKAILINSLGKVIVFLMLFFSVFLFTVKSNKRLSNYLFAIFLLITGFDLTGLFLADWFSNHPNFQILKTASSLLQMPVFYLYVLSVSYSDFDVKLKHFTHAVLFFIFLFIFKITALSPKSVFYYIIAGEVQYFAYIIAIFLVLKKHKTVYLENYSNPDYSAYKWLFQVTFLFCIAHIFVLLKMGFGYFHYEEYALQSIYVLISISALFIICWFVLKALYSPQLFTGVKTELLPVKTPTKKYRAIESDVTINESIKRLSLYMEKEKPYLDFELTLQKLASQFDIPERELSILINHHLKKHFFDFINDYRIDDAKTLLANPNNKKLTILEVLYKVGFNSKSSFYTAFKKTTNQTPTQYRKEVLDN